MKYAFLIIAHSEWDILRKLVASLDDKGNDIFIHFDKKVKEIPDIACEHSYLQILQRRIDVRWGTVSQIECEYSLFAAARDKGDYSSYVLISGVHLPLKSEVHIHNWLDRHINKIIFSRLHKPGIYQEDLKIHRISLFVRGFKSRNPIIRNCSQFMWKSCISIQKLLKIKTNSNGEFYSANNWAVFSEEAIDYLLQAKNRILKKYRWSFCGDEYFAPTELMASPLKDKIINDDNLLYCDIGRANATTLSVETDYPELCKTDYIFARKFSMDK